MNVLGIIRNHHKHWLPRTLSLLAVTWLGAVAQPCLAAVETHDQCPHCPVEMSDLGMPEGCTFLDVPDNDGQVAGNGAKDDAPDEKSPAIAQWPRALPSQISTFATGPPVRASLDLPTERLNTIYCVYLK